MDKAEIEKMFKYHCPTGLLIIEYEQVRSLYMRLAVELNTLSPDSAEKTLGLRRLQESMFWVLNSITRADMEKAVPDFDTNEKKTSF